MKINLISETVLFSKYHGVHTAFLNYKKMLSRPDTVLYINSLKLTDITHLQTMGIFAILKLINNKNIVATAHLTPTSFNGSLIGAKYWIELSKKYMKFFYNSSDLVLAVSPLVKEELQDIGVTKKIIIFPNPIDGDIFYKSKEYREEGRKKFKFQKNDYIILGVGQLQSRKGIEEFIMTAMKLPHYKFVWVGNCPFGKLTKQSPLLKKLLGSPPENFINIQHIPNEQMPLLYNAADIFLFPSYQETFGLANIEAASCGLPIILRDLPVYKNLYKETYLKGNNIEEFITLIKVLQVKKNYEKYSNISQKIADNFSSKKLGQILLNEYQKLLSAKSDKNSPIE